MREHILVNRSLLFLFNPISWSSLKLDSSHFPLMPITNPLAEEFMTRGYSNPSMPKNEFTSFSAFPRYSLSIPPSYRTVTSMMSRDTPHKDEVRHT